MIKEKILMTVQQYLDPVWNYCETHPYTAGLISGAVSVLLLFLIIRILFHSGPKRSSKIIISDEAGIVAVSAQAVSDLIHSLHSKFPAVIIQHVELLESRKDHSLYLRISVIAALSCSNFIETAAEFKKAVFFALQTMFGVSSITQIELAVRKVQDNTEEVLSAGE